MTANMFDVAVEICGWVARSETGQKGLLKFTVYVFSLLRNSLAWYLLISFSSSWLRFLFAVYFAWTNV